ncbi:MAG: vitamin B12 dependent-methionine synthase activation domain-containing protein [candidate division NC10 bacterium]
MIPSVLSSTPVLISGVPLQIDPDEVLRFQGYKKGKDRPAPVVAEIYERAIVEGEPLMAPRAVYRAVAVTGRGANSITAAGGVELRIPEIGRLWGAVESVGIAICTIGEALESRVRELWESRELPLAAMLDSVGSAAAECLAEYVNDLLCQVAIAERLNVTNRISPGYAGWDVSEQHLVWSLCPGDPAGVTLNSACFMTPTKSISFLVGIGAEARVDHYFTQCRRCWMKACAYRRAPAVGTVRRN